MSRGLSLWLFLGIVFSLLNLFCVGYALWKLDIMRGQRVFFNRMYVEFIANPVLVPSCK